MAARQSGELLRGVSLFLDERTDPLQSAISEDWPTTRIQRCYFHIFQTVRRHHTFNPRTEAGREILTLTRVLMNIRNADQAVLWLQIYNEWEQRWDQFLRHRTYAKTHTIRPTGIPVHSTWWYTHRDLRKTRSLFRRLITSNHLFTWIDPAITDEQHPLQRTTSPLEGGPNKALKDLFRLHRGLLTEHARRAAEWKLGPPHRHAAGPVEPRTTRALHPTKEATPNHTHRG